MVIQSLTDGESLRDLHDADISAAGVPLLAFVEGVLQTGRARMSLFGPFHLEGPGGENLTPRGQKARAVLALVALAQGGRRSRAWLCAKLWSDSPKPQAHASLRQSLADIRRALGRHGRRCVAMDHFTVSLDFEYVAVDALELRSTLRREPRSAYPEIPDGDFLEGLDVGDEEFEEWLCLERSRWDDMRAELANA